MKRRKQSDRCFGAARLGLFSMKTSILAGALLLMTAGLGKAADMPLKAPPPPPAPPVFSWTGFYVGADIGGIWGRSTTASPLINDPGCFATIIPCYLPSIVTDINSHAAQAQSSSSVLGSFEAGYNPSRDGGRPGWRPVIGVVPPPLWHQGHKRQPTPAAISGPAPAAATCRRAPAARDVGDRQPDHLDRPLAGIHDPRCGRREPVAHQGAPVL
jgi:hypothetical protein